MGEIYIVVGIILPVLGNNYLKDKVSPFLDVFCYIFRFKLFLE